MQATMHTLGRTQRILVILLLTIPELAALVPLALHCFRPTHAARDSTPPPVVAQASPGHPANR